MPVTLPEAKPPASNPEALDLLQMKRSPVWQTPIDVHPDGNVNNDSSVEVLSSDSGMTVTRQKRH